jgi:hypothetical protein
MNRTNFPGECITHHTHHLKVDWNIQESLFVTNRSGVLHNCCFFLGYYTYFFAFGKKSNLLAVNLLIFQTVPPGLSAPPLVHRNLRRTVHVCTVNQFNDCWNFGFVYFRKKRAKRNFLIFHFAQIAFGSIRILESSKNQSKITIGQWRNDISIELPHRVLWAKNNKIQREKHTFENRAKNYVMLLMFEKGLRQHVIIKCEREAKKYL